MKKNPVRVDVYEQKSDDYVNIFNIIITVLSSFTLYPDPLLIQPIFCVLLYTTSRTSVASSFLTISERMAKRILFVVYYSKVFTYTKHNNFHICALLVPILIVDSH